MSTPKAPPVWRPQSADEATQAVLQAAAQGLRLLVQGSGSRPWVRELQAARHAPADATLQLDQLSEVLWIDPEDRTCCVEAGISLAALDAALVEHGLMLPIFDAGQGTLGGSSVAALRCWPPSGDCRVIKCWEPAGCYPMAAWCAVVRGSLSRWPAMTSHACSWGAVASSPPAST